MVCDEMSERGVQSPVVVVTVGIESQGEAGGRENAKLLVGLTLI